MLSSLNRAIARIVAALRPENFDRDLSAELENHIKLRVEDYIRLADPSSWSFN
jgi:hypothetical protein